MHVWLKTYVRSCFFSLRKNKGYTFFYHNLQSSTSNLGNLIFTQVAADVKKYVDTLPTKVPYPLAAIYYDDPGDLVDSDTMRVSVGFT